MWTTLLAAPLFLGGLAFFFVIHALTSGYPAGLRSFAAIILPLMVLTSAVAPKIGKDAPRPPSLGPVELSGPGHADSAMACARTSRVPRVSRHRPPL
jgi:hypothetical protein